MLSSWTGATGPTIPYNTFSALSFSFGNNLTGYVVDFPTEGFTAKYSYIQQGSSKKGNDEPLEGRIAVADLVPASVLGYGGELARSSLYPGQTTLEVKVFKQKQSKNGSEGDVETLRSGGGGGPRPVCKRDFKFYPDCSESCA